LQGLPERRDVRLAFWMLRPDIHKYPDVPSFLRARRERPRGSGTHNNFDEISTPHCCPGD